MSDAAFITRSIGCGASNTLDWDDSQTDLANLAGSGTAGSAAGGDKLWEDNWDDDDIEEEFSTQLRFVVLVHSLSTLFEHTSPSLRAELAKTKSNPDAMQH